jgi:hypothetical protein
VKKMKEKHMKANSKLLAVVAVAALSLPFAARAEEDERVVERPYHSILRSAWDNSVTVNPIDMFTGTLNVEYERAVASRLGLYGGLNFGYMRGVLSTSEVRPLAIGPELGLRVYLIGRAPGGIWIGPYGNMAWVRNTDASGSVDSLGLGFGAMAGINLLLGQFNLSLGAGTGYHDYSSWSAAGVRRIGNFGVTPRLRLALGAVF